MDEDSDQISWDEYRKAFAAEPSSDSNYVAYYKILVNVYCKGFGHFPLVLLSGMFFLRLRGFWQRRGSVIGKKTRTFCQKVAQENPLRKLVRVVPGHFYAFCIGNSDFW